MSTNSIFILKPIWDALYEDAKRDREEMDSLKKQLEEKRLEACNEISMNWYKQEIEMLKNKVQVLEQYNRELNAENRMLKSYAPCMTYDPFAIDDAAYAAEANAPTSTYVEEKAVNEVVVQKEDAEKQEPQEESTKTVKMVGEKTKKEYQREYQRAYRKKQKNITMNV